jgi:hypothetical protein
MDVSDAKRLRSLEEENRRLKKLLAESILDQAALKELLAKKNGRARRQARSCRAASVGPASSLLPIARRSAIARAGRLMLSCAPVCAILPTDDAGSAIDGCSFCRGNRESLRASTASTGSIARKG